ncbi:hypothetical protein BD410DRAFT_524663 [Rickenella mellea]|uniref:Uncharacterized protein n=1 Tax=Rickenella mellea TaxID=50990 RepID=A0A4Y7QGZ7_9AGAM|nr:hypothetical protein BD410DRAFT_524663 [Rickenella mellea]
MESGRAVYHAAHAPPLHNTEIRIHTPKTQIGLNSGLGRNTTQLRRTRHLEADPEKPAPGSHRGGREGRGATAPSRGRVRDFFSRNARWKAGNGKWKDGDWVAAGTKLGVCGGKGKGKERKGKRELELEKGVVSGLVSGTRFGATGVAHWLGSSLDYLSPTSCVSSLGFFMGGKERPGVGLSARFTARGIGICGWALGIGKSRKNLGARRGARENGLGKMGNGEVCVARFFRVGGAGLVFLVGVRAGTRKMLRR